MILREFAAEFHKTVYLGRVLGTALGVDSERLARAESILATSIFHTAYDPKALQVQIARMSLQLRKAHAQRVSDAKVLAKTASYSDDVDQEEAFAQQLAQRKSR